MQTRIVIENGTAKFDVLDGEGTECQEKNMKYYDRLRRTMGLPEEAITEEQKLSMMDGDMDTEMEKDKLTHG